MDASVINVRAIQMQLKRGTMRKITTGLIKGQRGQALPLGIAAMLGGVALTLALFNTSQVTTEKERLANTADAAAYSGLVWEARALNFQAYMNRASVANQVAIAQTVSILSWVEYAETTLENLSNVPFVNFVAGPLSQVVAAANLVIQNVSRVVVPVIDTLLSAISVAEVAVHNSVTAAVPDVVRAVVKENDARFEVTEYGIARLIEHDAQWLSFVDRKKNLPGLTRMQDVVLRSRDDFSKSRIWQFKGLPNPVALGYLDGFDKDGGTRLVYKKKPAQSVTGPSGLRGWAARVKNSGPASPAAASDDEYEWQWEAADGISATLIPYEKQITGTTCVQEIIPIGWGSAFASSNGKDLTGKYPATIQNCKKRKRFRWKSVAKPLIPGAMNASENNVNNASKNLRYGGLRSYHDVKDTSAKNKDPRLSLVVEVALPGKDIRTSTHAGIGSPGEPAETRNGIGKGMFGLPDKFARLPGIGKPELSAIAKAEVYFKRPVARADGMVEYGNLFNPYWDVRLVEADAEREQLWIAKGLGGYFSGGSVPK